MAWNGRTRISAMVVGILLGASVTAAQDAQPPVASYLARTAAAVEAIRADVPAMAEAADVAAERLVEGGQLWAAGHPGLVSEVAGRAGGFIFHRPLGNNEAAAGDVVLYMPAPGEDVPSGLIPQARTIVTIGPDTAPIPGPCFPAHGGPHDVSYTIAATASAWVFLGELTGALTRLGHMPVMYETIGAVGATMRNTRLQEAGSPFHTGMDVPPVAPGVLGGRYIDAVTSMLRRLERAHRHDLNQAGAWAAAAKADGATLYMLSMGHLFPGEVGESAIGTLFESAPYYAGFRTWAVPDLPYGPGDVVMHIGYQHPPSPLLARVRERGGRAVYLSILGDRDYARDPDVIWLDPMWTWPDSCVEVEGYEIPILPASGVVNAAVAWELYRLTMLGLDN